MALGDDCARNGDCDGLEYCGAGDTCACLWVFAVTGDGCRKPDWGAFAWPFSTAVILILAYFGVLLRCALSVWRCTPAHKLAVRYAHRAAAPCRSKPAQAPLLMLAFAATMMFACSWYRLIIVLPLDYVAANMLAYILYGLAENLFSLAILLIGLRWLEVAMAAEGLLGLDQPTLARLGVLRFGIIAFTALFVLGIVVVLLVLVFAPHNTYDSWLALGGLTIAIAVLIALTFRRGADALSHMLARNVVLAGDDVDLSIDESDIARHDASKPQPPNGESEAGARKSKDGSMSLSANARRLTNFVRGRAEEGGARAEKIAEKSPQLAQLYLILRTARVVWISLLAFALLIALQVARPRVLRSMSCRVNCRPCYLDHIGLISAAQVFLTAYVDAPWSRPIHAVVTLICLIAPVPAGISVLRYCEHVATAQARRSLRPATA